MKMRKPKLLWYIFIPYFVVTLLALVVATVYTSRLIRSFYIQQLENGLLQQAEMLRGFVSENADQICVNATDNSNTRITVINSGGVVLCDSEEESSIMENHHDRPEILQVLNGNSSGTYIRYSYTLNKNMMYVAVPVMSNNSIEKIIRLSLPAAGVEKTLNTLYLQVAIGGFTILVIVTILCFYIAKHLNKPLLSIGRGLKEFSEGNFNHRIPLPNTEEMAALADGMNNMAVKLEKLEQVRSQFVANVSHELKTPITAIRCFVETIKEQKINDPQKTRHFLDVIIKHTDRLNSIIDDILVLSRIDQERKGKIRLENVKIGQILKFVVSVCRNIADDKGITLKVNCKDDIDLQVNIRLLEQAMVNLVDNAIKNSSSGSCVIIEAFKSNDDAVIKVIDSGYGIAKEHIPHIFERFYRVDKSRSRELGGTGLGLSIVKNIVIAHGGSVLVESEVGKGSVFFIKIPLTIS